MRLNVVGSRLLPAGLVLALAACPEPQDVSLPTAEEVEQRYTYAGEFSAELSGNVAVIEIPQTPEQLRSGSLWLKGVPYIFLFSRETQSLFDDYGGLAGVRVRTLGPRGVVVVDALLERDELNQLTWRRALNISGLARRDGTEDPSKMSDLVRWGEDHTEFEYNRQYIPR
jgi:hypothetical protein